MRALGRLCTGLLVMLLVLGSVRTASGHGLALPFAFWGGFPAAAARCQHTLGAAAAWCGIKAWKVRNDCLGTLLDGRSCEVTAVDGLVQQAHLRTLDLIDRHCTSPEAQTLGFLLKFEAQTDMDAFCHQLEDAMVSAVYRPVLGGATDRTTRQCVAAMTRAASTMLRYAFHMRRRALDFIAASDVPPSDKQALLDHGTAAIVLVRTSLRAAVDADCSAADFGAVYGRDASTVLDMIAQRADCLAGAVYVQTGVVCPAPVCGNGMREVGEECDDGNQVGGDGCRSDCTKEP